MPRKTTLKLSEALDQYLSIRASSLSPSTLANDRSVLRKFVQGVGDPQTHLLTAQKAETWFAAEAARQEASSYNKVRTRIQGFTAFCTRRGWLTSDPLAEVRTRRVIRTERRRLSGPQLRALISSTVNHRDRAMLATACNTGLRASDLTGLTIGDVDLDRGLIRVQVQKTGDLDWLPITADLDPELRAWLTWYAQVIAKYEHRPLDASFYLFPALGPIGTARVNHMAVPWGNPQPERRQKHPARVVHHALKRIGIETTKGEGFHTIRRSVGRILFDHVADQGHDAALRITAAQLGHKSTQTTELYLGISADRVKRDSLLVGRSFLGDDTRADVRRIS